jgi:streptomycin 6-kinase
MLISPSGPTTPLRMSRVDVPMAFIDRARSATEHIWLRQLPTVVNRLLRDWRLEWDGGIAHGSNAIALSVTTGTTPVVLRVRAPGMGFYEERRALRFWSGNQTVELIHSDARRGAMLLERLQSGSLFAEHLDTAVPVLARLGHTLAERVHAQMEPSTSAFAAQKARTLERDWIKAGKPFPRQLLERCLMIAATLSHRRKPHAFNADLHYSQVLRSDSGEWTVIDPILRFGDREWDIARPLWVRLDEMRSDVDVLARYQTLVREGHLDEGLAARWALLRTACYWLWGLRHVRASRDTQRCARLVRILQDGSVI